MGAPKLGIIPEGDEIEPAEKKSTSLYLPVDLIEDLKRVQKELRYKSFSKLVVSALRFFVEKHDADKKKK